MSTTASSTPRSRNWRLSAAAPDAMSGCISTPTLITRSTVTSNWRAPWSRFDMVWLEIDLYDPAGLALIRRSARTPIASLESIYGRRNFRPYFEQQSVDYAIIDVAWNGILESVKIAAMADAYEVNVAPHNFNGHLGSLISAHFCAVVPNFKVMEIDIDDVR